jgi:hypothetical protein
MELKELIFSIMNELENESINKQRKRYLTEYLDNLIKYQEHHKEEIKVPSHLELFCDLNPDALECRIYDD